jgi:hypothetical protein
MNGNRMNGNRPIGIPVTLAPKRATSDEEKLQKMMEMLLERSNNKLLGEMRAINRNLERTVTRLLENIEGVIKGDREVAIAGVVDGETDDLPRMSRIKAEATLIYSLKTGAIAKQLGLSTMRIAYLLNKSGLDWVTRKPELWGDGFYTISHTRLWHPKTVELLREVIETPAHAERKHATPACKSFLRALDRERMLSYKSPRSA